MVRKTTQKTETPGGESLLQAAARIGKEYKIIPQDYVSGEKFKDNLSTGIPSLDEDLNYGKGFPLGAMAEFFGKESGGKSYVAQIMCVLARRKFPDKAVVYVDLENSIMPQRMKTLGLDVEKDSFWIEVPQIGDAEKTGEYIIKLLNEIGDDVSLIVIDSLKAFTHPDWSQDKQTTHLSRFLGKIIPEVHALCTTKKIACVCINQVRVDMKAAMNGYYSEITPGGDAVNFFAHLRLHVKKIAGDKGMITIGDKVVGHRMVLTTEKSKLGIPKQKYYHPLYYIPVSMEDRLFDLGRNNRYADEGNKQIISMRTEKYTFKDLKVQGENEFKDALFENNALIDLYDELSCVCDVEGITREQVEEHYKNGREEVNLDRALSKEEYLKKEEEELRKEQAEINNQMLYATKNLQVEDIAE